MSYIEHPIHLALSVVSSTLIQESLVAIDFTTIYRYSLEGEYKSHTTIGGISTLPYRYTKSINISQDGRYALLCDSMNSKAILISLQTKKVLINIKMDKKPKFSLISSDMIYMMIANAVGRIAVYNIKTLELYDEFALPDEVSNASFTNDGSKIFVTTLNRGLYIYDISTKIIQTALKLNDVAEVISVTSDNNQVLLFTRSGNTFSYNVALKCLYRGDPSYEWPTTLAHSKENNVVLVGTRSSELFIYSAGRGNILGSIAFEPWGITSLSVSQSTVFVGFSDGNGILLDTNEAAQKAKAFLDSSNIEELSLLIVESPLIFINKEFCSMLDEHYEKILNHEPVADDERKGFNALLSLLLANETQYGKLYERVFKCPNIGTFFKSIELGENSNACKAAYEAPMLKQLKEFKELRTSCYKNIESDLRVLEKNPLEFKEYLESNPNACINCKYGAINYSDGFVEAYEKLKISADSKNYVMLLEITNNYPLLRQTNIFKRMIHQGESLIDKTVLMLGANKIDEALNYATKLTLIKPFEKTGNDFKAQIAMHMEFKKVCDSQNIAQIFALAQKNPVLKTTEIFKAQVLRYEDHAKTASIMALKGEPLEALKIISNYLEIVHFKSKNEELIKLGLLYEIKKHAPAGEEEELLKKYHQCFGWDKHYDSVCNFFHLQSNKELKIGEITQECLSQSTLLLQDRKK